MKYTADNYAEVVRGIYQDVFGVSDVEITEQDQNFSQYLSVSNLGCGSDEIENILKKDIDDGYKARIMECVLAPESTLSPFAEGYLIVKRPPYNTWLFQFIVGSIYGSVNFSPLVWKFIARILPVCMDVSQEIGFNAEDMTRDNREGLPPIVYFSILRFLFANSEHEIFTEEVIENLFVRWTPHDPIAFDLGEYRSGYGPYFHMINSSTSIDLKERAHKIMKNVVHEQIVENVAPRLPHERAVHGYMHALRNMVNKRKEWNELLTDLLSEMLEFSFESIIMTREQLSSFEIDRAFLILRDEKYTPLRRRIMRHLFTDEECKKYIRYRVSGFMNEDYAASMLMISDCVSGEDDDLQGIIEGLIAKDRAKREEKESEFTLKRAPLTLVEDALKSS